MKELINLIYYHSSDKCIFLSENKVSMSSKSNLIDNKKLF